MKEPECESLKCGHKIPMSEYVEDFFSRAPCQGLLSIRFPLRKSVSIKRHLAKEAETE